MESPMDFPLDWMLTNKLFKLNKFSGKRKVEWDLIVVSQFVIRVAILIGMTFQKTERSKETEKDKKNIKTSRRTTINRQTE